jgi:orotate phosphoribosyltransferase
MEVSGRCLFLREHILAHAAQGAHPILRKLVKGSTRIDSIVGIAYRGIINIAAYIAYILIHNSNTPYCGLISLI